MTMMDPVSDALISIKNAENASKKEVLFRPASKLIGRILEIMKEHSYINSYEFLDDKKDGTYRVMLGGHINECRAIKPRFAVKKNGFEKYEKQFLPSKDVGIIIVSTPKGVFSHNEAKKQGIGGRLLAYVY